MGKFAMEVTEQALFENLGIERRTRSLQIIFDGNNWGTSVVKLNELKLTLFRLLSALDESRMSDFILRVKITSKERIEEKHEDVREWLQHLRDKRNKYLVQWEFSTKKGVDTFIFTVSNKECRVNGYRYCWKMWSSSL